MKHRKHSRRAGKRKNKSRQQMAKERLYKARKQTIVERVKRREVAERRRVIALEILLRLRAV